MRWLGSALLAGAMAFAAGCATTSTADVPASPANAPGEATLAVDRPDDAPTPGPAAAAVDGESPAKEEPSAAKDDAKLEDAKNAISVASPQSETLEEEVSEDLYMNEEDRQAMSTAQKARQEFNRRNYDVTGQFDPAIPTLMGVAIGDDAASIAQRFGEPTSTAELPDDAVEASVLSYPGFTIGIRKQKVLFVEVSTRSINPGLNGLRLGDELDSASEKLGQPTIASDFVVTYAGNGSILKLDVDPDTEQIHSIKLFPEE
ncbi:hypothetical protein MO973_11885 [Paenibacillus sp. TRM 82003]|nr:hypothetical protein [Paenibacillus sp. TRM 82003]